MCICCRQISVYEAALYDNVLMVKNECSKLSYVVFPPLIHKIVLFPKHSSTPESPPLTLRPPRPTTLTTSTHARTRVPSASQTSPLDRGATVADERVVTVRHRSCRRLTAPIPSDHRFLCKGACDERHDDPHLALSSPVTWSPGSHSSMIDPVLTHRASLRL